MACIPVPVWLSVTGLKKYLAYSLFLLRKVPLFSIAPNSEIQALLYLYQVEHHLVFKHATYRQQNV